MPARSRGVVPAGRYSAMPMLTSPHCADTFRTREESRQNMIRPILIVAGDVELRAELNDSDAAQAIYDSLPIVASGNRWGEEIYFEIPVDQPLSENATVEVAVGDLGYWPPGKAFCIFFGRTPVSTSDQPRAASPVNSIGRVLGDATDLSAVLDGATVRIDKA
jgi:hypothetical protein